MEHHEKTFWDIVAILTAACGFVWEQIPTIASLAALIYTCIRISETERFKDWFKK